MSPTAIPTKRATIQPRDLEVGKPAPYDIEDAYGHLLLRRGLPLRSQVQRDRLLQIGRKPYQIAAKSDGTGGVTQRRDTPREGFRNPFDLVHQTCGALQETFKWLDTDPERCLRRLDHLISRIGDLVERDADAAIGAAHLDESFPYTIRHPIRQAILCDVVGTQQEIPAAERRSIVAAALSANVGMLEEQPALDQQREPLTTRQQRNLMQHPIRSVERLRSIGVTDETWLQVILQHHERLDGSGYPQGLSGSAISRGARLLSIADTYLAMISKRSYRPANAVREALLELLDQSGQVYDRELLLGLLRTIGIYPPGSFVSLDNGEQGIVIHRGTRGTSPVVAVIVKANGQPTARPLLRDTSKSDTPDVASLEPSLELARRFDLGALWGYTA
ncbi:MAG: HD-GYP domain-containing protein [Halorhodospira sp.]